MLIGIPKERLPNESRVAATPKTVEQLIKLGFSVTLEHDAGKRASFDDESYIWILCGPDKTDQRAARTRQRNLFVIRRIHLQHDIGLPDLLSVAECGSRSGSPISC